MLKQILVFFFSFFKFFVYKLKVYEDIKRLLYIDIMGNSTVY